jgi:hypothetical protein
MQQPLNQSMYRAKIRQGSLREAPQKANNVLAGYDFGYVFLKFLTS